jgi:hypothetical protein
MEIIIAKMTINSTPQRNLNSSSLLPPAARGALFEKTAPLDPPQKLFIMVFFIVSFLRVPSRIFAAKIRSWI